MRSHLGNSLIKFLMTVAKSLNFYYGKFSTKFHMYTQKHTYLHVQGYKLNISA